MSQFLQQMIEGLQLGSLYALIAVGYTVVYGIVQLINFAHGEIFMVGAFGGLATWTLLFKGTTSVWVLPVMIVGAALSSTVVALAMERIAYRPLRNAPRLAPLITAIGVSILLQTLAMIIWKPNPKSYPATLSREPIDFFGAVLSITQITILATTVIVLALLMWLVNRTNLGRAMRATAENPRVAALMGIKPDVVISATFIIGAMLAAIAGIMWASNYGTVQHAMGFMPGLKAFVAAVMGGIGNLAGAVVGGVALGLIESLGAGYLGQLTGGVLGSQYVDIFAFIVLALVLTLRPSGLLGERVADRA